MRSDEKSNISTKVEKGLSIDPSKQKDEIKVEEVASNPTLDEVENVKQLIKSIKRF